VWSTLVARKADAHFATFSPALIRPCILAGAPEGGLVLDPFVGSGTTGEVAVRHGRQFVGIDLNADYIEMANQNIASALEESQGLDAETADEFGGQLGMFAGGES
jgi:site-specific DNA-methyltransferase (adenine-specific)